MPLIAAASAAASTSQPIAIAVKSLPPGGTLQYVQVIGTLVIALIAAVITAVYQRRQSEIARGALKTADNKLRLDLFDKRYAMFLAGKGLIADEYLRGVDTEFTNNYSRYQALVDATVGASWLLDEDVEKFLKRVALESAERYDSYVERIRNNRATWGDMGWSGAELDAIRKRIDEQQATLVSLFRPFMRIRHKSVLGD